ncbi:MAG TPA: hypothetical protein VF874_04085 [Mycobacterium sp.]
MIDQRRGEFLRKLFAIVALIGTLAVVVAIIGGVWMRIAGDDQQVRTGSKHTAHV